MLRRIVDFSLDNCWIVLSVTAGLIALGLYTMWNIPIEAFPDLTNTQVDITVEAPGMSPTEVEQLTGDVPARDRGDGHPAHADGALDFQARPVNDHRRIRR